MFQEFYSKFSEKEKKIFYLAALLGVLALFDMLFLRPFLSRIHLLDEEIVEKRNALRQDLRFLSYKDKILNEQVLLNEFETDEGKVEEEIIAGFLKTVELLASEAKVNLSKINPADLTKKKGVVEYYAALECEGRLEDMMNFIHKIDETKNLLKVVKVDMSGSKTSADGVKVSMKIVKLIIDPKTIGNYPYSEEEKASLAGGAGAGQGKTMQGPSVFGQGGGAVGGAGPVPPGATGITGEGGGTGSSFSSGGTGTPQSTASGGSGGRVSGSVITNTPGGSPKAPSGERGEDLLLGRDNVSQKKQVAGTEIKSSDPSQKKDSANKSAGAAKAQDTLNKASSGGRVRVESFESLWARFFGKKKSPEEEEEEAIPEEGTEEEDPNFWQKKMQGR